MGEVKKGLGRDKTLDNNNSDSYKEENGEIKNEGLK